MHIRSKLKTMIPSLQRLIRAPYFDTYLNHLQTDNLLEALDHSASFLVDMTESLSESEFEYRYAPGKWTIKEAIHHTIETEIIFNYRALTIAKEGTSQILPGFEENDYVDASHISNFSGAEMLDYFKNIRSSTKFLLKSLSHVQLQKTATASGKQVQVEALFYITAGHTLHHAKVISERYLNQTPQF